MPLRPGDAMRRSQSTTKNRFTSEGPGGTVLRRVLPLSVALLVGLGSLRWLGERLGLYGVAIGILLMTGAAIALIAGLLWHFAGLLDRDEVGRREAEEELRHNSRYFEVSHDLVCTAGFDGVFRRLNAAWSDALGWTETELRSRPFVEFVHPDDRERTERETAGLAQGGVTVDFVNRYATKDGGWVWIDWRAVAVLEDGLIYASARDVTQRLAAEAALEASERQTRQILETAYDAFIQIDAAGVITDWNSVAEVTFGWSRQEVLGRDLAATVVPERHRDAHRRGLERFLATGEGRVLGKRLELAAIRRSGEEFAVELTISPLKTESGFYFNAFLRDVTERRAVERAKDEFVSVVSHELRTPLTSIRGSLGLLAGGVLTAAPAKAERMLEIALQNTDRLVRLINDILDIERMQSGKVELERRACDAGRLVAEAGDAMRSAAAEADVALVVSGGDCPLWADPDRVLQTLTNLISNAIKFSPRGARVWLEHEARDGQVAFRVRDEGRGIPSEKLESIFERFQQVDSSDAREKGGTGLGLAICRSIVDQHGGRIWAESDCGAGSTFCFTLPAMPVDSAAPSVPGEIAMPSVVAPPALSLDAVLRPRILICADDPGAREAAVAIGSAGGYEVITAGSGREALERAASERPSAILLDLSNPESRGWDTAVALSRSPETFEIPVVVLGAPPAEDCWAPPVAVAHWVEKPLDEPTLLGVLEQALDGRPTTRRVLVVEDDGDLAAVLVAFFERHGMRAVHAATGAEAVELSRGLQPDLLILDVGLPQGDGFWVADWLRQDQRLREVPTIVYTARDLDAAERRRLDTGHTSFMTKGDVTLEEFERDVLKLVGARVPTAEAVDVGA